MIKLGNILFRYRNIVGPAAFLVALAFSRPHRPFGSADLRIALEVAGVIVALAGEGLRVLTIGYEYIVRGGRKRSVYASELVVRGVFAHCRNPLYVGNMLIAIGIALVVHAYAFYLIVIPSIALTYAAIVAAEEAYLRSRFGSEYEDYCRRVNRWWPRLTRPRRADFEASFNWGRVMAKEYGTILLLGATLVCLHFWGEYQVAGIEALPSNAVMSCSVILWLALYLGIRALKQHGYISDRPQRPTT